MDQVHEHLKITEHQLSRFLITQMQSWSINLCWKLPWCTVH